ncbi:MAG TPA: tagatose 1,6-diphosphate aldolase [Terracidiphilus sp.]|jgi:tagatose 1,6-diphosphate aldolase|nr:tagatose 1,6-diphosphate aldolase [Terracidiphilus sp.]
MAIGLTPGKAAGLKAVSDRRGVIAALAMDQRGLLRNMLARELGVTEPPAEMMREFKRLVASTLTREASSILLDLEYGREAARHINGKGLLVAYEHAGYSPDKPERLPSLTEGWSALRLKEMGANAIKILVYYTPFEKEWVNDRKKAWIERIGAECKTVDIPFFLELLGYDVHGEGESSYEYASRKPEIVLKSMEEFGRERYGADVLKVEIPIQMAFVEGTRAFQGKKLHTRAEAMEITRAAAALTNKPIVYLSAGVSSQTFVETLELAVESGVKFHGVLGGRATWQDGVPVYVRHGPAALEEWLNTAGIQNVKNINKVLESAHPWHEAGSVQA